MNNTEHNAILKRLKVIGNNMNNLDMKDPNYTEKYIEQGGKLLAVTKEIKKL
jgi:hypothetical protein